MEEQNQECFFCKDRVIALTPLSCGHKICSKCIIQRIFCYQISELNQVKQMQIKCKCSSKASLLLNLQQINDLFLANKKANSSKKDTDLNCKKHNYPKDKYCLDCYHIICDQCHKEDNNNEGHQIEHQSKLIPRIKKCIANLSMSIITPEQFLLSFNETSSQLEDEVKLKFKETMQNIESLIKSLQSFYKNYQENYIKLIERGAFNLKLIKLFYLQYYLDLKNVDDCQDVNTLRYLNNINHMFDTLNTIHKEEIDLRVNEMKATIEKLKKIAEPIAIEFKYKEVPREYACANIISKAHLKPISSIIQLNNGTLITGSHDNTIKLWNNAGDGYKLSSTIKSLTGEINDLIDIDGQSIMGVEENSCNIKIWVKKNDIYEIRHSLSFHNSSVTCLEKLSDGRVLSGSKDKTVSIIKITEETDSTEKNSFHKVGSITQIDSIVYGLHPMQDKKLGVQTFNKLLSFKEIHENNFAYEKVYDISPQAIKSMCQLNDKRIVVGGSLGKIYILKEDGFLLNQTLTNHEASVNSLIQLQDGKLASASKDHSIIIWRLDKDDKFEVSFKVADYHHGLSSLIELKDGQLCASCSYNNLVFWRSRNDNY